MGGKKSKASGKPVTVPNKKHGLTHKDLKFLSHQTGLSQDEVKAIYDEFMRNNPDGQLDRREFARLYDRLRPEAPNRIDEISQHVFRAFDGDHNGYISFGEFLVRLDTNIAIENYLLILPGTCSIFLYDINNCVTYIKTAYALTSRGDVRHKLEYAFEMYDADNNGYLDRNELATVIHGMLDLLGADQRGYNSHQLAQDTMRQLDSNHDGKIRKDEFINGLLSNYALRALLSPFN